MSATAADLAQLVDYRRRVSDLYAAARAESDPQVAWTNWRTDRDRVLGTHPQSPVPEAMRSTFAGMPFFDYDPTWRLDAAIVLEPGEPVDIGHSGDGATHFVRIGTGRAQRGALTVELQLFWLDSYGGGVFVPFRDDTGGQETYGGGRYLLDAAKAADLGGSADRLVFDFNFAYHPSCAHDPQWSCPLAPPENRISARVEAGERLPSSGH